MNAGCAGSWPTPLPRHDELAKALNQAFQSAALGKASPEEALTKAAADWDRILSK